MPIVQDYTIVEETDRKQMETAVKRLIAQDWVPFGDLQVVYKEDQRMTVYVIHLVKLDPSIDPMMMLSP